jgi:hypothetical protein
MRFRTVFSGAVAVGLTLAHFGCGGAQEDYTLVSRPLETGAIPATPVQRDKVELSAATRRMGIMQVLVGRPGHRTLGTSQIDGRNMARWRES